MNISCNGFSLLGLEINNLLKLNNTTIKENLPLCCSSLYWYPLVQKDDFHKHDELLLDHVQGLPLLYPRQGRDAHEHSTIKKIIQTVSVILSDHPCKDGNARFTTVL